MANPNFKAIEANRFNKYFYETLTDTFERYNNKDALNIWQEGIKSKIFQPQFHGREHINVPFWMKKLKYGHKGVRTAFNCGVFGADFGDLNLRKYNFQAAWDYETEDQQKIIKTIIENGMQLFYEMFGYTSDTVISPSYTWSDEQEKLLWKLGAKQMQGILFQKVPSGFNKKYKKRMRFTKSRSKILGYQMRNTFFEPSLITPKNQVDSVLKRIENAFLFKKPAIIGSHRVNYIGVHKENNGQNTLKQLKTILKTIMKKWPDVEFMSAAELSKHLLSRY